MKKQTDLGRVDRTLLFTHDLIESFVNCRYKAYLQLADQHGAISDFEAMVTERKDRMRSSLVQKYESQCGPHGVADGRQTTEPSLREGIELLLECRFNTGNISVQFDGLKRTDGASALGPFHYIPVLFVGHHQITKTHRAVAEIIGSELVGERLLLNSHCELCEFQSRCRMQAIEEDNPEPPARNWRSGDDELCTTRHT